MVFECGWEDREGAVLQNLIPKPLYPWWGADFYRGKFRKLINHAVEREPAATSEAGVRPAAPLATGPR